MNVEQAPALREVAVKIISHDVCKQPDWYGHVYDEQSMLCAGYEEGGKDSCTGDSGGPLQCMTPSGRWKLAGVVSTGAGCAKARYPGIYVNVAKLLGWIQKYFRGIYVDYLLLIIWCFKLIIFCMCTFDTNVYLLSQTV